MTACIDLMADVQASISRGDIQLPLRTAVPVPAKDSVSGGDKQLLVMPGALQNPAVFGAKLLSIAPDNPQQSVALPVIQGAVLLFDGHTGTPIALVEAATLTAIRTAAASAAATRVLANPHTACLALLGYGVQAESHLEAMCAILPIREVRVWGPDRSRTQAFVDRAKRSTGQGIDISAQENVEVAVRNAELICAVSSARSPIIQGSWLAAGVHVNLVGAHASTSREADGATMARARIFTEVTDFALAEAGDILIALEEGAITAEQIAGEIGAVINGVLTGREHTDQITLYKSLGNTAQDLAAAHYVYDND